MGWMFPLKRRANENSILSEVVEESRMVVFRAHYVGGWPLTFISENISEFGYNAISLRKRNMQLKDILHPDDWAELSRNMPVKPKETFRMSLNLRIYDLTETFHTVSADLQLINKPHDVGFYIQGTFHKNTSQKVIPLLTALKFGQLAQLIDMLPVPTLVVHGHDFHSNTEIEKLTGYQSSDVFTVHNWFYLLFPGEGQEMEERYYRDRTMGFPDNQTVKITRKDGEERWVVISFYKVEMMELWFFTDVTDIRHVNSALTRQQDLFHKVIDALPVMLLMYDNQRRFTFVNKTLEKNTGYTNDDIKNTNIIEQIFPNKNYRQELWNHMQSQSPDWREVEITTKNGGIVKSSWNNLVFDKNTRVGIGLDITLVDQLQQTLKMTQNQFRIIANQLEDIVFILDKEKRYTGVYGTWITRTGLKESDFIGKTAAEYFGDTGVNIHNKHHERALCGIPSAYEFMIDLKGEKIWIRSTVSPLRDQRGAIVGAIGIGHNITAIKKTDEQLAMRERGLEASAIAFVIVNDQGIIEWANDAITKLTGYSVSEVIDKPISLIRSEKQDDSTYAKLWDTIKAGNSWTGDLINRKKDGSTYLERQTITPFTGLDGNEHYIAIKIDVTERSLKLG